MLDKPAPGVYDYARRAGPGWSQHYHAEQPGRGTMFREPRAQAEQKL